MNKCLICLQEICSYDPNSDTPNQMRSKESAEILHKLCRIFNISSTIYQGADDWNSLPEPLVCINCNLKISNAVKIQEQMELLGRQFDQLSNIIKMSLTTNRQFDLLVEGGSNSGLLQLLKIRKAYSQCWSSCGVHLDIVVDADEPEEEEIIKDTGVIPSLKLEFTNLQFQDFKNYQMGMTDYSSYIIHKSEDGNYHDPLQELSDKFLEPLEDDPVECIFILCHVCGQGLVEESDVMRHMAEEFHQNEEMFNTVAFSNDTDDGPGADTNNNGFNFEESNAPDQSRSGEIIRVQLDDGDWFEINNRIIATCDTGGNSLVENSTNIPMTFSPKVCKRKRLSNKNRVEGAKKSTAKDGKTTTKKQRAFRDPDLLNRSRNQNKDQVMDKRPSHRPVVCTLCGRHISRTADLMRHFQTVHKKSFSNSNDKNLNEALSQNFNHKSQVNS